MRKLLIACAVVVIVVACKKLALTGIGTTEVRVTPNFICSGDPVTVRWNVSSGERDRSFCSFPDGGLTTRTTCSSDRDCPSGTSCIDGLCVMGGIDTNEVDFGGGCIENTTSTINFLPGRVSPISVMGQAGARRVALDVDTDITVVTRGSRSGLLPTQPPKRVTVVPAEDAAPLVQTLSFGTPSCRAPGDPLSLDLTLETPQKTVGSEDVSVVSVQNLSPYAVVVQTRDPSRGSVRLASGARTPVLTGPTGRVWTVSPVLTPPLDPAVCGTDGTGGPVSG